MLSQDALYMELQGCAVLPPASAASVATPHVGLGTVVPREDHCIRFHRDPHMPHTGTRNSVRTGNRTEDGPMTASGADAARGQTEAGVLRCGSRNAQWRTVKHTVAAVVYAHVTIDQLLL